MLNFIPIVCDFDPARAWCCWRGEAQEHSRGRAGSSCCIFFQCAFAFHQLSTGKELFGLGLINPIILHHHA